ncbi:MAG: single-stranded-DNA-specific exonuclease RecJ, partial [Hespellia sp.]|nr:single-stranded-DNA-specific exonuclease RecJ [Hespellia sp.]
MEKWFLTMKKADFGAVAERFHISPIVARLIRNRDVVGEAEIERYLHGTTADLYDGMLMKDMERAVELLMAKMQSGRRIRVIGDYDIDGVNATYILKEGLSGLGARVDTDIPDRVRDGYGLNRMLVDRAIEDGIDTIVTCDNGIAASKEIAYGKQKGLTIIVTDHHEVPFLATECGKEYVLPPADAVVDPKQPGCAYPFRELCGAAVAYKLVEALYKVMGRDAKEIEYLIENVAIATVGDVMDLIGENRVFVKQGLEMLKETENPGLQALIECTGVARERLSAYHIGYILGPCMNAGGRLDTAKRTLALLEARSRKEAMVLAEDLKALNDSRKEMTEKGVAQAVQMIENSSLLEDRVLVVYLPDCHESIEVPECGTHSGRDRPGKSLPPVPD